MILMKNNQCLLPINVAIFLFVLVFALVVVPVVEGCGNRVAYNIDCTDIDIVEMVEDIVAVVVVSDSLSLKDMMIQEHC